ncbi:sn-glycerol-3-phosphate ABC transporter substrate-binding protein UgpB [Cobetia amphilecti]|jgi:sn-glycerol 3-phosphate transport system substrate-binding protein|uniref:sn-glycerol-3-phosphate-binding periplasmic protein UgpB n=1 Tax=Cobetia amphilecti TaxID=1055104 RepID=A0ABT6UTK7_9GAMM|nr:MULTISPECIES: sn-glycerol-3-phosphate ABC transporter substrate-binding protein UgpB [Cobetia]AVV33620.1 sn-glycerol-3-phosphate ABC transporter substrate-binding protein UgpB [Halomonas sp. SF2003]MBE2168202.1 sn-glycerol-3-phosphate ABC transporter substrate-binding protein UgpB [Cobetia sp. 2AS1]MBS4154449.1 sn-glycerol-3-phosphate ABC transporter substrate-binding protein UgpB [Cobetia sp. MC34]MDH2445579.1 sn-glycerol-3-phosphate ABC transporter substrate-binding protein UgpB [Cobetia s|tara:strand:- start:765 stop:2135 length:1371 start_codon:yes stop_codon:yes gene_type:complete
MRRPTHHASTRTTATATRRLASLALAIGFASASASALAATEVEWWHAMGGGLGKKVDEIAADFNASQDDYVVKPVFKGNYSETMTSAIAAFRAGKGPDIVQIFEVGTATMMSAKGAIVPVHQLMADFAPQEGTAFDPNAYLSAVTGYYTDTDGKMLSMPFNSSTPVTYYNKDVLAKAGVDSLPQTWQEMGAALKKVVDSGAASCGLTTTWPSWVMLENFSARNDVPFASQANGFAGTDTRLEFNTTAVVDHIQRLDDWQADKRFVFGGRFDDAAPKFYSGECAMMMGSSASYAGVKESAKGFEFGVAPLPYDSDVIETPQNSIIGGASLWVLSGHSDEEYQGVAKFFQYLSKPEVQADWHQFTGYLPITTAAAELTREQGFYAENPGTDVAITQMTSATPTENSKGLRLGNMVQIRDVINEELEKIFSGKESVQDGLDNAVKRGDSLLEKFERANG